MIETEHTPGPWGIIAVSPKLNEDGATAYVIGRKDFSVRDMTGPKQALDDDYAVCIVTDNETNSAHRANVRLICSAPDLFLALNNLLEWMEAHPTTLQTMPSRAQAYAAIAKAKGTTT